MKLVAALCLGLALIIVSATANAKAPSAPAAPPDIASVLAAGSDAQGWGIQNVDEITLNGIRSSNGNPATAVTLRQGVQVQASNGDAGENAGNVDLTAGYGNGGSSAAAEIHVQGGRSDGANGKVVIVTDNSAGHAGDCLKSDGAGHAVWAPC